MGNVCFFFLFVFSSAPQDYGFQAGYNGDELSCTLKDLRRSTSYKFRVCAKTQSFENEDYLLVGFLLKKKQTQNFTVRNLVPIKYIEKNPAKNAA